MHWKSLILLRTIEGKNNKGKVSGHLEAGNDKQNKRWKLSPSTLLKYLMLSMDLQPFVGPWRLFQFLILYIVDMIPWMGDESVARPLPTHRTTQTQNKCKQTSMPRLGFEPTIPVFEGGKTVCAATVIDEISCSPSGIFKEFCEQNVGIRQ
jgi:hypothetical protein